MYLFADHLPPPKTSVNSAIFDFRGNIGSLSCAISTAVTSEKIERN